MSHNRLQMLKALRNFITAFQAEGRDVVLYLHPGAVSPTHPGLAFGSTRTPGEVILWRGEGDAPSMPVEEGVDEFLNLLGVKEKA